MSYHLHFSALCFIFSLLLLSTSPSYICAENTAHKSLNLSVGKPNETPVQALGVEFDPHFLTQNVTANNGTKESDWNNVIIRRLELLQVKKIRVMILPQWYEPRNDNDNPAVAGLSHFYFDSPEMIGLCRLLDIAQHSHIMVTLTFWGVSPRSFMNKVDETGWMIGPANSTEWAENVSVCLRYLLCKKKYSCIQEITPVNEPDWSFSAKGRSQEDKYIDMCRVLDKRLRQDGLRKLVKLNLSDNSDGGSGSHHFLQACTEKLGDIADLFNSHTYIFGYTTPNSTILNWEKTNVSLAKTAGKAHFIGEFGSNQTVGATKQLDINRYERGILMARIVINLLNAGACGASYWGLLDQYYSKQEALNHNNMQQLGLWKYLRNDYQGDTINKDICKDYEVRPQYFAFGMLSRFIQPNSKVYPILTDNEWIAATALRNVKKHWTYLFANPLDENIHINISNAQLHGTKNFKIYQYLCHSLPQDDSPIKASASFTERDGHLVFSLPASSFVILKQE